MTSAARRYWRRLRQLGDQQAQRLALAALPIRLEPAGRAGRACRVTITYKTHQHTLWLPGQAAQVGEVVESARRSLFGKYNRISGSIIQGYAAWSRLAPAAPARPLTCLFIGYGMDTYDAQLLANLGLRLRAEFLDVLDFEPADPRWQALARIPGIEGAAYHQVDARCVGTELAGRQYDLIAIIRGSVDLMPPDDYQAVLAGCRAVLAPGGLLLAPVIAAQYAPAVLAVARRSLWLGQAAELPERTYTSQLGEFHLWHLGQYRYVDVAFREDEVDFHQALVEQLRLLAAEAPEFAELPDLLAMADADGWLVNMATFNGRAGRLLTAADGIADAVVGAFDITRRPSRPGQHWGCTARCTLVIQRPADAG